MNNTIGSNATLAERYKYSPDSVTPAELLDALEELERWRTMDYETPEDVIDTIAALEGNQCPKEHGDYDDLKSFFEDCVSSLNSDWPCAEVYDTNLRQVICDAISKGDTPDED